MDKTTEQRLAASDRLRPTEMSAPDESNKVGDTIVITDGHDTYTIDLYHDPGSGGVVEPFHIADVLMVGPDVGRRKHLEAESWEATLRRAFLEVGQSMQVGIWHREKARRERR